MRLLHSYELLFSHELRVTVYCTCYELLLLRELRVTFCIKVVGYWLLHELRVNFVTMNHNKDKDDKTVYDDKVMIKNYSLRLFFDKELMIR